MANRKKRHTIKHKLYTPHYSHLQETHAYLLVHEQIPIVGPHKEQNITLDCDNSKLHSWDSKSLGNSQVTIHNETYTELFSC